MSLLRYLRPSNALPTAEQTGLPASVNKVVNSAVQESLERDRTSRKRKYTTTFTPEVRASIGRYAAENGNASAVKKYRATYNVGESTVRLFKKMYLKEVKQRVMTGVEF